MNAKNRMYMFVSVLILSAIMLIPSIVWAPPMSPMVVFGGANVAPANSAYGLIVGGRTVATAPFHVSNAGTVTSADIVTKGPWVDVRAYATFATAISAIGSTETTLMIPNEQSVAASITIPANVELMFLQNGSLAMDTGVTVTISGPLDAENTQIFSGSGSVKFGRGQISHVIPQWWGALGTGVGDDSVFIQKAIDALRSFDGGEVFLPAGFYTLATTLDLTGMAQGAMNGVDLRGAGRTTSILQCETTGTPCIDLTASGYITISDLTVRGMTGATAPNVGILMARNSGAGSAGNHTLRNIWVIGEFVDAGIFNYGSEVNLIDDIKVTIENGVPQSGITIANTNLYSVTSPFQTILATGVSTAVNEIINSSITNSNGGTDSTGIYLYGRVHDVRIVNNSISTSAGLRSSGIRLGGPDSTNYVGRTVITGNRIEADAADYSIYFTGDSSSVKYDMIDVSNNTLYAGSYAIYQDTSVSYIYRSNFTDNSIPAGYGGALKLNKVVASRFELVEGDLDIDTDSSANIIINSGSGTYTASGTDTNRLLIPNTGAFNLGAYGTTNTGPITGATTGDFSTTVTINTDDVLLYVSGGGGTLSMRTGALGADSFLITRSDLVASGDYTISSKGNLFIAPASGKVFAIPDRNVGIGTTSPGAMLQIDANASTTKGLIVKGAAAQTANALEIQASAGTVLAAIDASGNINTVGNINSQGKLDVAGTATLAGPVVMSGIAGTAGWYVKLAADGTASIGDPSGGTVNSFENWAYGTTTIVADSPTDTVTLIAGSGIGFAMSPTDDSLTITSSGGSAPLAGTNISVSGQTVSMVANLDGAYINESTMDASLLGGTIGSNQLAADVTRDSELASYLPLSGGTMTGALNMGAYGITNTGAITGATTGTFSGTVTAPSFESSAATHVVNANNTVAPTGTFLSVGDIYTLNGEPYVAVDGTTKSAIYRAGGTTIADSDIVSTIARDTELFAGTFAALIGSASDAQIPDNITISAIPAANVTGSVQDAQIVSTLMRDSEWTAATLTAPGKVELATTTETITGTDATRAVTPDGLTDALSSYHAGRAELPISATVLAPTAGSVWPLMKIPYAITITGMDAVSVGGTSILVNAQEKTATYGTATDIATSYITAVPTTAAATTIANAAIAAGNWLAIIFSTETGTVSAVNLTIEYTRD